MSSYWTVFVAVICLSGVSAMGEEVPTILAFGDSITAGGPRFVSYRKILVPELSKRNLSFRFIGPKKDATSAHAGYSGRSTKSLLKISADVYKKHPADIVLIHSGHNSFSKNKPVPGIVEDTAAIIDNFRKINPEVKVLLAQVIPAGKLPKYSYIPELNGELELLATRLKEKGVDIALVDLADGFDWEKDTVGDRVHPNASGAKKMAEKWMTALLPLLGER